MKIKIRQDKNNNEDFYNLILNILLLDQDNIYNKYKDSDYLLINFQIYV